MSPYWFLVPIFLPILGGMLMYIRHEQFFKFRNIYSVALVTVNALIVWAMILFCGDESVELFRLTDTLALTLRFDGMGRLFAGLSATLWPLTTLYAIGYMRYENNRILFFSFFVMSFGVTMGICAAGNLLTLYCFYEMLTLSTIALVIHPMTKEAQRAARVYVLYSIGGAAFAFIGLMFLHVSGVDLTFVLGGSLQDVMVQNKDLFLFIYCVMFLGLGVKAAIFPLHAWLPTASVAPTPVTALLHAVAVVKAGAFALIRLTYYCYGTEFLRGTWAQNVVMGLAMVTILYGSAMALKQQHFKRRLAYSTVSNLSYIIFGLTIMTPEGMAAALLHLLFHAVIKILAFFCAGNAQHAHLYYVQQLPGAAKRMPVTFITFAVAALALTGVPPLNGFVSKFGLLSAAAASDNPVAYAGMVALLISALLTAMYMFTPMVRAFFPAREETEAPHTAHEAERVMLAPMIILAAAVVLMGLFAGPFADLTARIAAGLY